MTQETLDKIKETKKRLEKTSNDVLYLVMCEFIERQRNELNIDDNVDIFITAEENGNGIDVHIEDENNYPKFVRTIKHNCT